MSNKVVVVHSNHQFCGYHSDSDYEGNAIFEDDLLGVFYVSRKKAHRFLSRYARSVGARYLGGNYAYKDPEDERYSSEQESVQIMDPGEFLFEFGSLRGDLDKAKELLGEVAEKDMSGYLATVDECCSNYDPF